MEVVIGVDIGSLGTKTVILNNEGKILSYDIVASGFDYKNAAEQSIANALKIAGCTIDDVNYIVSTGYGRGVLAASAIADKEVTEIICHAKGAHMLFPDVRTIIDIGGQDSKIIRISDNGAVLNFVMNDKCAAGTGRFLEVMSSALSVELTELGDLMLSSEKVVPISSMCTVFAESEVISLFAEGVDKADIAAGIYRAIARRVTGLVGQIISKTGQVTMTGGVAKSKGMIKALEKSLGIELVVAEEPQIMGALGAALIAHEKFYLSNP